MSAALSWSRRGLYLIPPEQADTERLLAQVAAVLPARPALVQYRNKRLAAVERAAQARALIQLCGAHGIGVVVNDDPALALAVGALGVHLGCDDGSPAQARALLGADAIVGVSCYAELARAEAAAMQGASYVAFGAVFPSSSKPRAPRAPLDLLRASAALGLPRVAIGGIGVDNAQLAVAAGADLIAVIAGVFDAPDPLTAAHRLQALYENS